ncbi:superoxide dismutase [Cu-Zn], chloroplastic-like [Phalaenopsis equestris]|uniref:superoxide dismutase [Cu-Zn], chloroplastic-like n=1 Tax=Phalaenopsis equestris TaxID=78828 RepID=UPI0009E3A697|nr:superoxide dismutase [Cu-Zn], chloroplastic-like [Phalaenopsis equestris]
MQAILAAMAAHTVLSAVPTCAFLHPPSPPSSASLLLSTFLVEQPLRISLFQLSSPAAMPKPLAVTEATKKAVAILKGSSQVEGIVTLSQENDASPTILKVRVSGLSPGPHGFHIHDYGDISNGCISTGSHFNPNKMTHGAPEDNIRHAGDLGNIIANADGVAETTIVDAQIPLSGPTAVIGRSLVVHELEDDLGKGGKELSLSTGNAGGRLACGVVGLTHLN